MQRLVDLGNTVVLIEHNLDIIKAADFVIDLGPEAGIDGGQIVVQGTPEAIVKYAASAKRSKSKMRSWTGEALAPVLKAGPYKDRKVYDDSLDRWKKGDMEIEDVGKSVKMPWQADGRRWHTQDRVGRNGEAVNWEGKVLEKVVDKIQENEGFSETNWGERSVVEIAGTKKSNGWFFHGLTGECWLLKLKFRVRPRTFKKDELTDQIPLATANELDDVPIYGNQPRVSITNNRGGWQEVEIRAHSWHEINIPGFWEFVDKAIDSFLDRAERVKLKIDDHSPWAKLGQKWHFMRKGFSPGKEIKWDVDVLESLHDLIQKLVPDAQFTWSNKQLVHVSVPPREKPWASFYTKKLDGVWLQLNGPRDQVTLGSIADFADEPSVKVDGEQEIVKMKFSNVKQLNNPELKSFLQQHLENCKAVNV